MTLAATRCKPCSLRKWRVDRPVGNEVEQKGFEPEEDPEKH